MAHARQSAERERSQRHHRGPVTNVLLAFTIVAVLCTISTAGYGIYNFPDSPIRLTNQGYVGKTGKPYTAVQFEAFTTWKRAMLIVFPTTFVCASLFAFSDSVDQHRERRGK